MWEGNYFYCSTKEPVAFPQMDFIFYFIIMAPRCYPQTDGQKDGWMKDVKPVYPPFNFVECNRIYYFLHSYQYYVSNGIFLTIWIIWYPLLTYQSANSTSIINHSLPNDAIACILILTTSRKDIIRGKTSKCSFQYIPACHLKAWFYSGPGIWLLLLLYNS